MSNYIATVFKSGNSYALRLRKEMVDAERLKLGDKVEIGNLTKRKQQDREKIRALLMKLQTLPANPGSLKSIKDPVAWQREIRKDRPLPGRD
ncbi:MAG TPA: AbrB/MazE/SpoVT family DNA-binding domain-containing protein [Candidatus Saccharimonadales bacterium]|nr:AbrB/MazE/SpoVT family DNA-binding domain-containing protein [Candidatus Saccharimonadales bacterium]